FTFTRRRDEMATARGRILRMRITIGLTVALLCAAVEQARADRRTMIRAYEFQTQPKGNLEFELWNTIEAPRSSFADSVLVQREDFGRFALVGNLVGAQHLGRADLGRTWEVDFGARYELMPQLRVAAEFWTTHEFVGQDVSRNYYLGPSISVATQKLWFQIGAGFGLDAAQDQQMQIRSVLGFNL